MKACHLIIVLPVLFLMGCSQDSKMEQICTDIAKSVSVDPSAVKINSVTQLRGSLSVDELIKYRTGRAAGTLGPAQMEQLEGYRADGTKLEDVFVTVDNTTPARVGILRDKVLCRYHVIGKDRAELVSVTARGRDYSNSSLFMLFLDISRPKNLSISNTVE